MIAAAWRGACPIQLGESFRSLLWLCHSRTKTCSEHGYVASKYRRQSLTMKVNPSSDRELSMLVVCHSRGRRSSLPSYGPFPLSELNRPVTCVSRSTSCARAPLLRASRRTGRHQPRKGWPRLLRNQFPHCLKRAVVPCRRGARGRHGPAVPGGQIESVKGKFPTAARISRDQLAVLAKCGIVRIRYTLSRGTFYPVYVNLPGRFPVHRRKA